MALSVASFTVAPAPVSESKNMRTAYEIARRLENSANKAFAKNPQGKALARASALSRKADIARREAQILFAKENPCTVWPNFCKS
jgi:hypothetical protein